MKDDKITMKVNKPRLGKRKNFLENPPARLRAVLPVLIKLQNISEYAPSEILDILMHIRGRHSYRILTPVETSELVAYLKKYGYNSNYLEEEDEDTAIE